MSFNKFARSLTGSSVIGFVGKNAPYTTQSTIDLFSANAIAAEIGVFHPETKVLYTSALTEGQKYVICQMRDGFVKMSPSLTWSNNNSIIKRNYVAPVNQVSTAVFAYSGDGLSQDTIEFKIIETTPLSQHLPVYNFSVTDAVNVAVAGALVPISADAIAQLFVLQINNPANPVYAQSQPVCTASFNGVGTGAITLTAIDSNSHFRTAFSAPDTVAYVYTLVTPFSPGSGIAQSVAYVEAETFVNDSGVGTNYPKQALPSEFHSPTSFVDLITPGKYEQFFISAVKTQVYAGTNDTHSTPINVWIAAISSSDAASADVNLTTVLAPALVIAS